MIRSSFAILKVLFLGCLAAAHLVNAQGLRDPTVPPPAASQSAAATEAKTSDFGSDATAVIVREGRPYLVQGSRLYEQGQQIGQTRIERITETSVWLREDGVLRKQPVFPGIQLRVLPLNALPPGGPSTPLRNIFSGADCNATLTHSNCSSQKIKKSAP